MSRTSAKVLCFQPHSCHLGVHHQARRPSPPPLSSHTDHLPNRHRMNLLARKVMHKVATQFLALGIKNGRQLGPVGITQ
ncbi:UNVERIFIED_CONTAM: hypothetical protein Sradi_7131500 [Sesamum radiatum]|uniref:Uncharacterized protein n=1 Tax=Sesamum radiatum TaxID=300843 RepID=A0AAW2IYP7_SESRA